MEIKKFERTTHPKISHAIEIMLVNPNLGLVYYGEFSQMINYYRVDESSHIKTAGVNFSKRGMNFYYNEKFVDSLTQEQVNFLVIHEIFHLIFRHSKRTIMGGYNHDLSNIAQDQIINSIIVSDISPSFINIPTNPDGTNSALFVPKDYEQEWIFEILYFFLKDAKEESVKRRQKKNDDKLFEELFCESLSPINYSLSTPYKKCTNIFKNMLIEKSKREYESYINNFVRQCLLYLEQGKEIELYGHSSSLIPTGENDDFNEKLTEKRADLFKKIIIDNIDKFMDIYSYCIAIFNDEDSNLSIDKKRDYIISYEEIQNEVMVKQRSIELDAEEKLEQGTISHLFKQYRFAELCKFDENTLMNMCIKKNLPIPDVAQEKVKYVTYAENLLIPVAKSDTDKIIMNDNDDYASIINKKYSEHPRYKNFVTITDTSLKQGINRRLSYKFPDNKSNKGMGAGNGYGKNGANGQECFDLNHIFDEMNDNNGQFMDSHIEDSVSDEMREEMVKDAHNRAKSRLKGKLPSSIQDTLNKLVKKKKDYLKEIKRGVSFIKGFTKEKSFKRLNRRGIIGLKGKIKYGSLLNVILDVSGSMSGGYIEKTLSYVFRNDIVINLIQADAKVQQVLKIKNMKELQKMQIIGFGGTELMPAIDYVAENLNNFNTVILTDGYCDNLDLSRLKGKVLLITCGTDVPIVKSNGKVKEIKIED